MATALCGTVTRLRTIAVSAAAALAALASPALASAGFAISPASGATTTTPVFTVYLEPQEVLGATVYVATTPDTGSYFIPTHEVGSCTPATPAAQQFTYSCQPSFYSPGFTTALPPGTYYWWLTFYHADPGSYLSTLHISGPLVFTVPAPTPPSGAGLVGPADGAVVSASPTLTVHAPAGATVAVYAALTSDRLRDGSPAGVEVFSCSFTTPSDGDYACRNTTGIALTAGDTYYWWAVIRVAGNGWIYGPRSFRIQQATPSPPPPPPVGGNNGAHAITDAPLLPRSAHFADKSIKQTRLSSASYALSKFVGSPKLIGVACWNDIDWPGISGDDGDGPYTTLAFFTPAMPRWIQLSPRVCRAAETLLYHRPPSPNAQLANGVETVTHEMMHALGIRDEAEAECFGMQLSIVMAVELGVPTTYADRLAKLNLVNYRRRPPDYQDPYDCRESGPWDLFPSRPSPPWHSFGG